MKLQPYTTFRNGKKETGMMFYCPACRTLHRYRLTQPEGSTMPLWSFNGSMGRPSFTPSLLLYTLKGKHIDGKWVADGPRIVICHLFVTDGVIEYCDDNPHALKGQKIPLPDIPPD